jgi:hypothetical protein
MVDSSADAEELIRNRAHPLPPESRQIAMHRWIASCCVLLLAACEDDATLPPTLVSHAVTTAEDTAVTVEVLLTARDASAIALSVVTAPKHGTLSGAGPSWTYTPAPNYNGSDSAVVRAEDSIGSATATIAITVTAVDDGPVAHPDSFAGGFNMVLNIPQTALLANDTDVDGPALTVTEVVATEHGVAVLGGSDIQFTPEAGFQGMATFEYTISDGTLTAHATVSVTIGVDEAPIAADDAVTTPEDTTAVIADATLLANDSDPDHQTIRISDVSGPSHGLVMHSGTQTSFVPDQDFHGVAQFSYTITDGFKTAAATVVVTVTSVNDAPVAVSDVGETAEDTPLTFTSAALVANDSDRDGDDLAVSAAAATENTHGAVTLANGVITYTPEPDFSGGAEFSYTVSDGNGGTATALVEVTVTPVNDAPVAVVDVVTTDEDIPLTTAAATLAANDIDVDGDPLLVTAVTATATTHGTVSLAAGTVTYTPDLDYNGAADFSYTVSDGSGGTASGSVQVTVISVNDAPIVATSAGTASYIENAAPLLIDPAIVIADVDSSTLTGATVQLVTGCTSPEDVLAFASPPSGITATSYVPATCTLTLTGPASLASFQAALRLVTYVNISDAPSGAARVVRFTVDDGEASHNTASAQRDLSVTSVDDNPVAEDDTATVAEDASATAIPVLANDSDVDAGPRSISDVTQPANGIVAISIGATAVTYTPNLNYCNRAPSVQPALDTFTYTLSPGGSTATVSVTVICVDDAPVAVDDDEIVVEDSPANSFSVLANDTDIDSGPRAVTSITQPGHGLAAIGGGGLSVLYTPTPGYCNQAPNTPRDAFTYTLTPGGSSATVSVTVPCACGKNKPTDFVVGSN